MTRRVLIGGGLVALLGTGVLVPLLAGENAKAREVVLIARDMSFRVPGQPEDNPVIRVDSGETIRLVLQNDDDGIHHDLSVPEWGVGVAALPSGTRGIVDVRVPDKPGRVDYICKRHGVMMKGIIEIGRAGL